MSVIALGESIPALTSHATSVSLPKWSDNVGYEEGSERVLSKMVTGYPRFYIHKIIATFADTIVKKHGEPQQEAMLFPSFRAAKRCTDFVRSHGPPASRDQLHILTFGLRSDQADSTVFNKVSPSVSAVLFANELFPVAKQYWQHSGDGISSRRAEFCHSLFQEGILVLQKPQPLLDTGFQKPCKGPKRYQKSSLDLTATKGHQDASIAVDTYVKPHANGSSEHKESSQFLEERFGRNLDVFFVDSAKTAIRRRIAGSLNGEIELSEDAIPQVSLDTRGVPGLTEHDVYLYPCGMNSIFHAHRMIMEARGPLKSISFGFPYVDTLKILEKFGPGCIFYGNGSTEDLDDLENRLKSGEKYQALFCEFPGNPMLKCPDLRRIRALADTYDFAVVIDETIGECNVMGGGAIFNPRGRYYSSLKKIANIDFEDNFWAEDAIFMERNSRHFITRIERINHNAELICDILQAHPLVKDVYYPKVNDSRSNYDSCRLPHGGYGGLLSFTFHKTDHAIAFYDRIETAKGPSLGTNFTLVSPYVILAHYLELDWAARFGVPADLIRVSVGLEDSADLKSRFVVALAAAEDVTA